MWGESERERTRAAGSGYARTSANESARERRGQTSTRKGNKKRAKEGNKSVRAEEGPKRARAETQVRKCRKHVQSNRNPKTTRNSQTKTLTLCDEGDDYVAVRVWHITMSMTGAW